MKTQDPKFTIEDNRLHGQSGIVPDDEPLFILRARDPDAIPLLLHYMTLTEKRGANVEHVKAVAMRVQHFADFQLANPTRMKTPDTDVSKLHDTKL